MWSRWDAEKPVVWNYSLPLALSRRSGIERRRPTRGGRAPPPKVRPGLSFPFPSFLSLFFLWVARTPSCQSRSMRARDDPSSATRAEFRSQCEPILPISFALELSRGGWRRRPFTSRRNRDQLLCPSLLSLGYLWEACQLLRGSQSSRAREASS